MTDARQGADPMHDAAMAEWLGVLAQLWTAAGKPVDVRRLDLYGKLLEMVPLGLLERAVARVIRENAYPVVPPPGAVWSALRAELGNPPDLHAALVEWMEGWWGG